MLENIKQEVKDWNWKSQHIWNWKNIVSIPNLIARIERWEYKIKNIKYNIKYFNLAWDNFECWDLFEFLTHIKLVENSDLQYPIILNNKWQVIDWRHRICKAILEWKEEIDWVMILNDTII